MATPDSPARAQTRCMIGGAEAWKPQATLALVTTPSSASSSPRVHWPKPSPRSEFRSICARATAHSLPQQTGTVSDALDVVARLRAAGCVFAEDEAALLLEAAAGDDLDVLVARRVEGEPLEQVLGWAEFSGLRFAVEPGVFVPRQRTRVLVREAVALL